LFRDSTAQHSTAQHSTAQHSTAQHSTAQHLLLYFFEGNYFETMGTMQSVWEELLGRTIYLYLCFVYLS
jgi:hypothetical protein